MNSLSLSGAHYPSSLEHGILLSCAYKTHHHSERFRSRGALLLGLIDQYIMHNPRLRLATTPLGLMVCPGGTCAQINDSHRHRRSGGGRQHRSGVHAEGRRSFIGGRARGDAPSHPGAV